MTIYSDITEHSGSSTLLIKEPLGIAIPENHPLCALPEITRRDLGQYGFISLSPECSLYRIIAHYCQNANFLPNITAYVDSPALMRELLKMNIGAAFVPEYTWAALFGGGLTFRYVADMPMERFVHLSENEGKYSGEAVKTCRDTIIGCFAEYSQK